MRDGVADNFGFVAPPFSCRYYAAFERKMTVALAVYRLTLTLSEYSGKYVIDRLDASMLSHTFTRHAITARIAFPWFHLCMESR